MAAAKSSTRQEEIKPANAAARGCFGPPDFSWEREAAQEVPSSQTAAKKHFLTNS